MILFLLISAIFCASASCALWWFFAMIRPDGALDIVFDWQAMLQRLYNGSKWQQLRGKALGDCHMCTCFWFMPLWFILYYAFSRLVVHCWITDSIESCNPILYWLAVSVINITWYACFHCLGAMIGFATINKLLDRP